MSTDSHTSVSAYTSVIDNQGENTLQRAIQNITETSAELCIATAYFSLDALAMIAKNLHGCDSIRIIFGDEANRTQRAKLLEQLRTRSDQDLAAQRLSDPTLDNLQKVQELFKQGKIQARCYTTKKFHAKTYLTTRQIHPPQQGVLGSGNFTRPGLTQNIELNVELSKEQAANVQQWFNERWEEAVEDDVTADIEAEIKRQVDLYDPYAIYLKALLAWGDHVQGRAPLKPLEILPILDPHQEHAYRQAIRILQREPGVMICDGVGLGKSFVALALMEHWLSEGSRVLLVAPKAILKSSWEGYLRRYLGTYNRQFSKSIQELPMTWFGLDPETDLEKVDGLKDLIQNFDVVVVDESHNFRNSATQRYKNLYEVVAPNERGRKRIVLLTATPINTRYEDLTNQFQLLTHEEGTISGIARLQLNRQARNRDKEIAKDVSASDQDALFTIDQLATDTLLGAALESVAIQRSRATCRDLAEAAGKHLRFPKREKPQEIKYTLGAGHETLIREASLRFQELGRYLVQYVQAVETASEKDTEVKTNFGAQPQHGLKFSGYLPNLFDRKKKISNRQAQIEAFLAKMVFVNVMKQLESSTPAFQSIIEALGQGLALRLRHYCGDDEKVQSALLRHEKWTRLPANPDPESELGFEPEDAAADEASGGETDDYICREERRAIKRLRSLGFSRETHDIDRWRDDILNDLEHLQSIHDKCLSAQLEPDAKLEEIAKHVREQRRVGRKVLVFTQSRKTADYIQRELEKRVEERVALVNADIGGDTRARILNAFSPNYNDLPQRKLGDMRPLPELNILVSTDVLSEGVNLQEAGCILNYDLHWNPTRLIQRIGRVDRRLREEDPDHSFDILNVFPPRAINDVIQLVDTVERRQRKISHLLGIDVSFFKSTDEEGTLKEFNRLYEGGKTPREAQMVEYVRQVELDSRDRAIADALPHGGFGVWDHAPLDGFFALFQIAWRKPEYADLHWRPEDTIPESDLRKFGKLIGAPRLLALETGSANPNTDAAAILEMLCHTVPGEQSGLPRGPDELKTALSRLKSAALASIPDRTQSVTAELICWMELRKNA